MKYTVKAIFMLAFLLGGIPYGADAFSYQGLTAIEGGSLQMSENGKDSFLQKQKENHDTSLTPNTSKQKKSSAPLNETLRQTDGHPMMKEDFTLSGIALGDTPQIMTSFKGVPSASYRGEVQDTLSWDGLTVTFYSDFLSRYMNRSDLPVNQVIPEKGISDFYITGGDFSTVRGIRVGSSRENVLRAYGRPDEVLWDGDRGAFYLIYSGYKKELSFKVKENHVGEIHIGWKERQPLGLQRGYKELLHTSYLRDKDFTLAGYTLNTSFHDYTFSSWEKKMANPREEIWYYPGYAVRITKKEKMITALFLIDNKMITSRGLAVGDAASTAELLYGSPQKLEMDVSDGIPRTAYVYFSRAKDKVLLIYMKDKRVDGVVVAENPQKQK